MKTLKKILLGLIALVVIAVLVGGLFVRQIARKALPDYNQSAYLTGLTDGVVIYRDQHAVPYIYASNEHDLYLAVGYVMAQDRLWQMDLLRRVTMGRLSEIFGEDMVGADHLLRALRIPEKSEMVLQNTSPEILNTLEAFCLGVNQYIERNQKKLPPEFSILGYKPELWKPIHSMNLIGYMAWDLSGSWNTEVVLHKLRQKLDEEKFLQLIPDLDYHKTYVHPDYTETDNYVALTTTRNADVGPYLFTDEPESMFALLDHNSSLRDLGLEIFSGSNSWAVSGQRTTTGYPLFSNDSHLGFGAPGIWIQMHHEIEGQLKVTGVALPGQPFIINGHNEHIAWGMTNLYVDDIDFYLETINAEQPDQYLFNGEWKDMDVRQERIAVKGGDTIVRENRFTHRGPVISGFKKVSGQDISMRWTGNEYSNEMRSMYLLNRASNWDDFRDALSGFGAVSQNVTYADVNGNIGQQTAGGVPLRNAGRSIYIYPGDTSYYDWIGMLAYDELPYTYNPPDGQVSSANNRTVGDNYPYYIGHWFDTSNRIDRIRELLNGQSEFAPDDFKRMLADAKSKLAERVIDDLLAILGEEAGFNDTERQALGFLSSWDGVMAKESPAATVFEMFYSVFMRNILLDEMREELYREFGSGLIRNMFDHLWRNPRSSWVNNVNTSQVETFDEIVVQSFRETVTWMEENLGEDTGKWNWGRVHQLTLSHPMGSVKILDRVFGLNKGPYPMSGSFHTIANNAYGFHNPFAVVHGASQRHIFDLADWSDNHVVIPTGTSGIPSSKYYLNQTETFVEGGFYQKPWNKEDVAAQARYKAILAPSR